MWPGEQPPGGEQNPQNQNPYQQQGYQQPNPYQQPGYQQPNPYQQPGYQQPTAPQYAVPGQMPGAPQPPQNERRKTTIVAIVAATAVVATAVVTGVIVLKDDGKGTSAKGGGQPAVSTSPSSSGAPEPGTSPTANPRGGEDEKPTIEGWKVVTNPKHGTQFDVPADWEVAGSGVSVGFDDEKKNDGTPAAIMGAPAEYKSKWCTLDTDKDGRKEEWDLATTGTKGASGAKDTAEAARGTAYQWAWAAYAQTEEDKVKVSPAKEYTTKSGLQGSVATATAKGVKKTNKCETDGKAIAFGFKNEKGDFKSWVLYANAGIPDEVPDETIQKILSTVRVVAAETG
ncbi:hypothetical protein OHS70_31895 [Streptomyces sp. NBC_00390]|uniref:hypothetical protein n=1 Tax=Streptomyces sp. NBC_00390 TaxID=2975736 RepID=UPI002E232693